MPRKPPIIPIAKAFDDQVLSHPAIIALKPSIQAAVRDEDASPQLSTRWSAWDLQRLTEGWFFAQPRRWPVDADLKLRSQINGKSPIGALRPLSLLAAQVAQTVNRMKLNEHGVLTEERRKVWNKVDNLIQAFLAAQDRCRHGYNPAAKAKLCAVREQIREFTDPRAELSAVARWCILFRNEPLLSRLIT